MKPSDFFACSREDKGDMFAFMIAHAEMDAVDAHDVEEEHKKLERARKPNAT